jgi:tetratricopeptide (TPR) repeat protein
MSAYCHVWRKANGWLADTNSAIAETERLARTAARLGSDDAVALAQAGFALAFVVGELDDGMALIDRAVVLNPNLAAAWRFCGFVHVFLGQPDLAVEPLERALRLSPLDPFIFIVQMGFIFAHFFSGRYEEALASAKKSLAQNPTYVTAIIMAAVSAALAGRDDDMTKAVNQLLKIDPSYKMSNFRNMWPLRRAEDWAAFEKGLQLTKLPE